MLGKKGSFHLLINLLCFSKISWVGEQKKQFLPKTDQVSQQALAQHLRRRLLAHTSRRTRSVVPETKTLVQMYP